MPQMTTSTPRRRLPAPIFSLPVLIILFPIFALLLLFLVVPSFLYVTTQILSPLRVRKSWDTLNICLVLLAIISGVLARKNDGEETNNNNANAIRNDSIGDSSKGRKASGHHVSQQWFEHPERKTYDGNAPINVRSSPASSVRRLKRSCSSYPDMRQDSLWVNNEDRFRIFDDFEMNKYRSSSSYDDQVHELHRTLRSGFEESEAKVIPVDTFVLRSSPLSTPPAPPHADRNKPRRTYQADGHEYEYHKVMNQNERVEINEIKSPSVIPPPRRPPSPLIQVRNRSEQKHEKLERRKSTATEEIRMVFASLRKRKKKQKSKDRGQQQDCPLQSSNDSPANNSITIRPTSPAPPPPPPPPPPSSVFQKYNLFRKGSKRKKIHYVPTPPPPPPPSVFSFSKRSSKNTQITPPSKPPPAPSTAPSEPSRKRTTSNNGRPPLPTKANTTSYYDNNVNSGGQSPLIPMPPPPPLFKMPDFVKLRSSPSSWYNSPDMEEIDVSSSKAEEETATSMMENDDGVGISGVSVYCPSPDVNAKADTFIARLRDGWKLENITP